MEIERRFTPTASSQQVVHRGVGTGRGTLDGYAAVFNQDYILFEDDTYYICETIAPGAFTPVLQDDVRCLFNHQTDNILGRVSARTLALVQDAHGLAFRCALDTGTTIGNNVFRHIQRRDVTGCSFAFIVETAEWTQTGQADGRQKLTRTILSLKRLIDVGPVTLPAYEGTSVTV